MNTPDLAVLYGSPMSLYTGRARSYLIKSRVPYVETLHVTDHYYESVLPRAGNRRSMPTLELPGGEVIRDSVAIVDYFESHNGYPFTPKTPCQKLVSLLVDVIAAEGMLRPAMHYRWNHESQREYVEFHFRTLFPSIEQAEERMDYLRAQANPNLGIVPETVGRIEASYVELLVKLNRHFSEHPYLLGTKPSIGDFGLIAPMYGHLGRDPVPLSLLQNTAVRAFRWVERMNRPEPDIGEFGASPNSFLSDDQVPDTLIDVLKHFAVDFVPETKMVYQVTNEWLANNEVEPGTPVDRGVGLGEFEFWGIPIKTMAQPFRLYLLSRFQHAYQSMADNDQKRAIQFLEGANMTDLLGLTIARQIRRHNNLEVWV